MRNIEFRNSFYIGETLGASNIRHGLGLSLTTDGTISLGNFDNGELTGYSAVMLESGQVGFAKFTGNSANGRGFWHFPEDNSYYYGTFSNGCFEGDGFKVYSDLRVKRSIYSNDCSTVCLEECDSQTKETKYDYYGFGIAKNVQYEESEDGLTQSYACINGYGEEDGLMIKMIKKNNCYELIAGLLPIGLQIRITYNKERKFQKAIIGYFRYDVVQDFYGEFDGKKMTFHNKKYEFIITDVKVNKNEDYSCGKLISDTEEIFFDKYDFTGKKIE